MPKIPDCNPVKFLQFRVKNEPDCNPAFFRKIFMHFTIQTGLLPPFSGFLRNPVIRFNPPDEDCIRNPVEGPNFGTFDFDFGIKNRRYRILDVDFGTLDFDFGIKKKKKNR